MTHRPDVALAEPRRVWKNFAVEMGRGEMIQTGGAFRATAHLAFLVLDISAYDAKSRLIELRGVNRSETTAPQGRKRCSRILLAAPCGAERCSRPVLRSAPMQVASPFIIKARGEEPVKIGLDDPFTGTYAAARQERADRLRAGDRSRSMPRAASSAARSKLLVEDSTSADTGTAVQKARKLIERDKVNFLLGNVNSAMALALGAGVERAEDRCTSSPAATPTRSPARTATGTCSASATRRAWKPTRSRRRCSTSTARSGTSSPRTMPSATPCSRVSRRASRNSAAPRSAPI